MAKTTFVDDSGEALQVELGNFLSEEVVKEITNVFPPEKCFDLDNVYYLGHWPIKIFRNKDNRLVLCEFDFARNSFSEHCLRSARLWLDTCEVLEVPRQKFSRVSLDDQVVFSKGTFDVGLVETIEGVRGEAGEGQISGWTLYNNATGTNYATYEAVPMSALLLGYNLRVIRFLGLPVGWEFQLRADNSANIWGSS